MFYLFLIFILVFACIGWRVMVNQRTAAPPADEYECPHCNEQDCICKKNKDF